MNETKNLWNTKVNDLTVGDSVKLSVVTPILVMGGVMLAGGVVSVVSAVTQKIRKSNSNETPEN